MGGAFNGHLGARALPMAGNFHPFQDGTVMASVYERTCRQELARAGTYRPTSSEVDKSCAGSAAAVTGYAAQYPRADSTTDDKSEACAGSAAAVMGDAAQDSRTTSAKDVKSEPCAGSAAAVIGHAAQYPRATFRVTENNVPEHESSAALAAQTVPRATCCVSLTKA